MVFRTNTSTRSRGRHFRRRIEAARKSDHSARGNLSRDDDSVQILLLADAALHDQLRSGNPKAAEAGSPSLMLPPAHSDLPDGRKRLGFRL